MRFFDWAHRWVPTALVVAAAAAPSPSLAASSAGTASGPGLGPLIVTTIPAVVICSWLDREGCDGSLPRQDVSGSAGVAVFRYFVDTASEGADDETRRTRSDGSGVTASVAYARGSRISTAADLRLDVRLILWRADGTLDTEPEVDVGTTGLDSVLDYCFFASRRGNACLGAGYSFAWIDAGDEARFGLGVAPHLLLRTDVTKALSTGVEVRIDQVDIAGSTDAERLISYGYMASLACRLEP